MPIMLVPVEAQQFAKAALSTIRLVRGIRYCHGELVHWRKEKRRVRKLALLNIRQRLLGQIVAIDGKDVRPNPARPWLMLDMTPKRIGMHDDR